MGKIIQEKIIPLSSAGGSLYLLIDGFAKEFLTGKDAVDKDTHEAHVQFSINKKGDHYMAVWIEKKR